MKIFITESQYHKIWKFIHESDDVVGTLSDVDRRIIFRKEIEPQLRFLRRVAYKYYTDSEDRDELVQKTMIRAYENLDKYKPDTNSQAWLQVLMRNIFISDYRSTAKDRRNIRLDNKNVNIFKNDDEDDGDLPNTGYENMDFSYGDEMSNALDKLPQDWKDIFIMSYVEDMSYEEIADKYNIPMGTVRSRLNRVKMFLQKELNKTSIGREIIPFGKKEKHFKVSDREFGVPTVEDPTIYYPPKSLRPKKVEKIDEPVMSTPKPFDQSRVRGIENDVPVVSPIVSKSKEEKPFVVREPRANEPGKERKREYTYYNDNISFDGYSYVVRMMINGKRYQSNFHSLEDAIRYQNELIKLRNEGSKNKIRFDGTWYVVEMMIKGTKYWKRFKDKDDAIRYKDELLRLKNS